ncbi:MAG TPA: hypothetical protein PKI49_03970 [Pseudomonadota bacterium]|nr:hypothetical protein [Pseudomonadota bacterium]HNF96640.1 hypothetical protein [Pseudomonadota bacterium]HNI60034.1 hypothetical protein [Pseudomonadota bacterium]HNK47063.1 hypothetical protein [Pseudomonadota bacterium]HNN51092.1 hypothetical protein [Pseudomonadota bacterium]
MATDHVKLYVDEFAIVSYSPSEGVFRFARTTAPYPSIEAAQASYDALLTVLSAPHAATKSPRLLVDMRAAPARNDPPFEEMQKRYRGQFLKQFVRVATLLTSRAGLLQVQRYGREDGRRDIRGFLNEEEAVQFLRSDD